jgi:hypothetical protein
MEVKVRRILGFIDDYSEHIPEEFSSFIKQLKGAVSI